MKLRSKALIMSLRQLMCIALTLFVCSFVVAAEPTRPEPMAESFFAPELLVRHAQEIGLDDKQKDTIQAIFRENRQKFGELQQDLQKQLAAMSELMHSENPDEHAALAQLDKVLDAERQIKRIQLSLFLSIRKQLTPEQQAKAKELRQKLLAGGIEVRGRLPEAVRVRMQQLQERVRTLQAQGRDMHEAIQTMLECRRLAEEGKTPEAVTALDRALASTQDNSNK